MLVLSLIALFVYLFGAYAFGSATALCLRQLRPVWGGRRSYQPGVHQSIDKASLALFSLSTAWFVVHTLIEFRDLTGGGPQNWLDLSTLMAYLFPPVIMHTVYLETQGPGQPPPHPAYRRLLVAMYVLSPLAAIVAVAAIFDVLPQPANLGALIGLSIGFLFALSSAYCTTIMIRRPRPSPTADQRRMQRVMIGLFIALGSVFFVFAFLQERRLLVEVLIRVVNTAPLYFFVASVYFENRFEFYDLVVKRALLMLMTLVAAGGFFLFALRWLDQLPAGSARPWLFAAALVPLAMVMPWLHARTERWLDHMWFGREFTPVEAVKHVLAAMQPATDEASLIEATEQRLTEIFGARIAVLIGDHAAPEGLTIEHDVTASRAISDQVVRFAVLRVPGTRPLLSEDLQLLRSLVGVFGFMLEKFQLQRRRREHDQLAQELRLQTSKSELKALRAQINPHFLFNALNAIASLIHTNPAQADTVVEQLAEVFRYTLRRSDSEWAPLDQELAFARAYLDVEQARFGPRLTGTIDSDHLSPAPHVPSMLLQTLIENAVKHGVSQAREAGRIDVVVRTTSDEVIVEVRDTGPGARSTDLQPRDGEGFGLRSVRERLRGHFGDRGSFTLTRDEAAGVTIARVTMPHVRMPA